MIIAGCNSGAKHITANLMVRTRSTDRDALSALVGCTIANEPTR